MKLHLFEFEGIGYGEFKSYVGDVVSKFLEDIQSKYNEILSSGILDKVLDKGIDKSRELAKEKYDLLKELVGLER